MVMKCDKHLVGTFTGTKKSCTVLDRIQAEDEDVAGKGRDHRRLVSEELICDCCVLRERGRIEVVWTDVVYSIFLFASTRTSSFFAFRSTVSLPSSVSVCL